MKWKLEMENVIVKWKLEMENGIVKWKMDVRARLPYGSPERTFQFPFSSFIQIRVKTDSVQSPLATQGEWPGGEALHVEPSFLC